MTELVALTVIFSLAVVAIVANVFGKSFWGNTGPDGLGIEVGGAKGRR
jgi:hypothetical protein